MVSIQKSRVRQAHWGRGENGIKKWLQKQENQIGLGISLGAVLLIGLFWHGGSSSAQTGGGLFKRPTPAWKIQHAHPNLHLRNSDMLEENYNAIALDIFNTLECRSVISKSSSSIADYEEEGDDGRNEYDQDRRRLVIDPLDDDTSRQKKPFDDDDAFPGDFMHDDGGAYYGSDLFNVKHLFCLAASTDTAYVEMQDELDTLRDTIHCDASRTRQQPLLDLWSNARAQFPDKSLLLAALESSTEVKQELLGIETHLWYPTSDMGVQYLLNSLNTDDNEAETGDSSSVFEGLVHNLGPGHVYVDVGSCMGISTLAVLLKYPGTKVVSIEPATPNWLLQQVNLVCNLPNDDHDHTLLLAGVGPQEGDSTDVKAAAFLWRPDAISATRSWTPVEEKADADKEIIVQLKPFDHLMREAEVYSTGFLHTPERVSIDVLHVDCEGCEYNFIPALTQTQFEMIGTVLGSVHWGYIPAQKLPSTLRMKSTHSRLCQHEQFARHAKECCAFLDTPVKSRIPGEVLYTTEEHKPLREGRVRDILNETICEDFESWAAEKHLWEIDSDFGWFEMTSTAS